MRELLTETIDNKQQIMMTKLTEAKGQEFRNVILLICMGCETNVRFADWMV